MSKKVENIYYVYFHICETTKKIIYIGKGKNDRAYQTTGRSKKWKKYMRDNEFSVKMYKENLSEMEALTLEHELIEIHKREQPLLNVTGVTTPQIKIVLSKDKKYKDKKTIIAEREKRRAIELEKRKKRLEEQKKREEIEKLVEEKKDRSKNTGFIANDYDWDYSFNNNNVNKSSVSESEKRQLNYLYGTGKINKYHYFNKKSKW